MRIRDCTLGADDSVRPQNTVLFREFAVNSQHLSGRQSRRPLPDASTRKLCPGCLWVGKPGFAYFVRLQPVQLSSGLMHGSFFPGKNASIGKSIWLKTSQGLSVLVPPTGGQVFDGTQ